MEAIFKQAYILENHVCCISQFELSSERGDVYQEAVSSGLHHHLKIAKPLL